MAAIASAATAAGLAARRAGGGLAAADVTGVLRSMVHAQTGHSVLSRRRWRCRDAPQSHPRGLTRKRRPLYSAGFAAPALWPATEGPCGGTGRRARLKIEFRKECWFDSGQGHHRILVLIVVVIRQGCPGRHATKTVTLNFPGTLFSRQSRLFLYWSAPPTRPRRVHWHGSSRLCRLDRARLCYDH